MMEAGALMKVMAVPESITLDPGASGLVSVAVTNVSNVIDAYVVEVFGLDPEWVVADPGEFSLFPGESSTVNLTIQPPDKYPASQRTLTITVRSANDSERFELASVDLRVRANTVTSISLDPTMVTAGRAARFGIMVDNDGNAPADVTAYAIDPEDAAEFIIEPAGVIVLPGEQRVISVEATGGRTWFGQPRPRTFTFGVNGERRVETIGTFIQRPRVPRWVLALLGLLVAAAVFAFVLSKTFDRVVEEASVDDDIVNEALASNSGGGAVVPTNPGSISGRLTSTAIQGGGINGFAQDDAGSASGGVAAVQIDLFLETDTERPVASAATDENGDFVLANLGEADYKLRFSGAGYPEVWFKDGTPGVTSAAEATSVAVALCEMPECDPSQCPDCAESGVGAIQIGAIPVEVSGDLGSAAAGATLTLIRPGITDPDVPAIVAEITIGPDGSFSLDSIPSPADYEVVVEKPGAATVTRRLSLEPGESIDDIGIELGAAEGVVEGIVNGPDGPLGGATIVATDGTHVIETVTFTDGAEGQFVLRNLASPGRYTVTASADGFEADTQSAVLVAGQTSGASLSMNLVPATGLLEGTVLLDGVADGDVIVTVTGPNTEQITYPVSASGAQPGRYVVSGLAAPALYTVAFSGDGVVPETRTVQLLAQGGPGQVPTVDLRSAGGTVSGFVFEERRIPQGDVGGPGCQSLELWRLGNIEVTLTDGNTVRRATTTTGPSNPAECGPSRTTGFGEFVFDNVTPGPYTLTASREGSEDAVRIVDVVAGTSPDPVSVQLARQATITGAVLGAEECALKVRLYRFDRFGDEWEREIPLFGTSFVFEAVDAPVGYLVSVLTLDSETPLATTSVTAEPNTAVDALPIDLTNRPCGSTS